MSLFLYQHMLFENDTKPKTMRIKSRKVVVEPTFIGCRTHIYHVGLLF